ncbi:DUF4244 domain-containing protein [Brevibacterium samyangense]|uniref:DUF4244 domain-containing protein n=1 Tax=Brevibacterium samyangense TaxID=366888 RepID=A0ABN2T536_9MICO
MTATIQQETETETVTTEVENTVVKASPRGRFALARQWRKDTGATTAEYAIVVLAACGFGAVLIAILKSDPITKLVTGVISKALGLGG